MATGEEGRRPLQKASDENESREAWMVSAELPASDQEGVAETGEGEPAQYRWAHHHPEDMALLEAVRDHLREMAADQPADQLVSQPDGREALFTAQAAKTAEARDAREDFFRHASAEPQRKPTGARGAEEELER